MPHRRPPAVPTLACLAATVLSLGSSSAATAQLFDTEAHVSKVGYMVEIGASLTPEFDKLVLKLRLGHILNAEAYLEDHRVGGVRNVGSEVVMDVRLACTDRPGTESTENSEIRYYTVAVAPEGAIPDSRGYRWGEGPQWDIYDAAFALATDDDVVGNPHTVPLTLVTAERANELCGSANIGTERLALRADLMCWRQGGFSDSESGSVVLERGISFDLIVTCDPDYRVAGTVPVRWRHSCPDGWVVSGTDQQNAESGSRKASCVKPGFLTGPEACPYAYVLDPALGRYVLQGEIMRNLVGRAAEALQALPVPHGYVRDGELRISIREEKDEISFINYLALEVGDRVIPPESAEGSTALLTQQDDRYFRMSRGDELTLVFDVGQVAPGTTIRLLSAGYYEPYRR